MQRLDLMAEQVNLLFRVEKIPGTGAHQAAHRQGHFGLDLPQKVGVWRQAAHGQRTAKFQPVGPALLGGAGGGQAVNTDFQQLHVWSHPLWRFPHCSMKFWIRQAPHSRKAARGLPQLYVYHNE